MPNVKALRWLDRWVGLPICFVLTAIRWLTEPLRRVSPNPPRSIVFIKLVEQGSTVLAYGALRRVIDRVGKENVFFLVFEENRYILDAMELIQPPNVLTIRSSKRLPAIADILRALMTLRRHRVEAAIDLEFFARGSAALAWLSGCTVRVGFHASAGDGPHRGDLMTHRLRYNPYLHTAEIFRLLVEALDARPGSLLPLAATPATNDELPPQLVPCAREIIEVSALIQTALGGGGTMELTDSAQSKLQRHLAAAPMA